MGNKSSHSKHDTAPQPDPHLEEDETNDDDLPTLKGATEFLNDNEIIRMFLKLIPPPPPSQNDDEEEETPLPKKKIWNLLYNSNKHGKSYNRFCTHVCLKGPNIIIIRDTKGNIFGGFASESWKDKSPNFYGTEHCFVFSLHPERKIYRATGLNRNFQYLNVGTHTLFNGVGQGGQQGFFGWCLYDNFDQGHCRGTPSTTFGNPVLSSESDFDLDYMEVWQVLPPSFFEEEKLAKRNAKGSVLSDDGNAEKVIVGMTSHNFSHYNVDQESGNVKNPEPIE